MYKAEKGDSLFLLLQQKKVLIDTSCGGKMSCGKCKIKITQGNLPVTEVESSKLSKEEIENHIRLACAHPNCEESCSFEAYQSMQNFSISGSETNTFANLQESGYAIAIDVGTTTVVMELIHLETGKIVKEISFVNPQKLYGADVITRIAAVQKEGVIVLQKMLLQRIEEELSNLKTYSIKRMCICGNPTMTHLLLGEDPSSIAQAPYSLKVKDFVNCKWNDLYRESTFDFLVQVLPSISAYIGSDIVMDIYHCRQFQEQPSLLIDLGTNGELSLCTKDKIFVCSAACGPAFEGGNMQCGTGAIKGAIDHVQIDEEWHYTTIGNIEVEGICGSGYMSFMERALKKSLIEDNGYMKDTIFLHDKAYVTQKDVREFQLAKSAIASAITCLCHAQNLSFDKISRIYIAGGFGKHIQMESLLALGILPYEFKDNICVIGNSAIQGLCQFTISQDQEILDNIMKRSETLVLANSQEFTTAFMDNMMFQKLYED